MKLLPFASSALLASSATALSFGLGSKSSGLTAADDSFAVPGENPLVHCQDPADDILAVKSVDLDPNPPAA